MGIGPNRKFLVNRGLRVFIWQLFRLQKVKLGAEKSHALRVLILHLVELVRELDVGRKLNVATVLGHTFLILRCFQNIAGSPAPSKLFLIAVEGGLAWVENEKTLVTINNGHCQSAGLQGHVFDSYHSR